MRSLTSTDCFVRTPSNTLTVRYSFQIKRFDEKEAQECIAVARINVQNFSRSVAVHLPNRSAEQVVSALLSFLPNVKKVLDFALPGGNIIISKSPDIVIGSGIKIQNNELLGLSIELPGQPTEIDLRSFRSTDCVFVYCDCDELDSSILAVRNGYESSGYRLILFGNKYLESMSKEKPKYFLSYDARNKNAVALPIAGRLMEKGESVWFDAFQLKPGDNILQSIDNGLKQCRQCVLLVSKEFLSNTKWARVEFDSIFSREVSEGRKIIIPVWIGVNREEVSAFSLALGNKFAVVCKEEELSTEAGLERVAHAITTGAED